MLLVCRVMQQSLRRKVVAAAKVLPELLTGVRSSCPQAAFQPRSIRHPLFRNVGIADAVDWLMKPEREDGDCLFRPSHRGPNMIHVTIRLDRDNILHVDIEEGPKVGPAQPSNTSPMHHFAIDVTDEDDVL